jgi:hypothetical protein
MRPTDLLQKLEDRPFKPFRLHMSDGTIFNIAEPGMILVGASSAVVVYKYTKDDEGHLIADRWRTVALSHIVQMSDLDEHRNGEQKPKRKRRS